jgi:hypothetical protein
MTIVQAYCRGEQQQIFLSVVKAFPKMKVETD